MALIPFLPNIVSSLIDKWQNMVESVFNNKRIVILKNNIKWYLQIIGNKQYKNMFSHYICNLKYTPWGTCSMYTRFGTPSLDLNPVRQTLNILTIYLKDVCQIICSLLRFKIPKLFLLKCNFQKSPLLQIS